MRFRPDKDSIKAALRDMDISIDDYAATYLNYDGNTYPLAVFGGDNGAWQFGGQAPIGGPHPNEEPSSDDYESLVGGLYKACAPVFAAHNHRRAVFSEARFSFQQISNGRAGHLIDVPGSDIDILRNPFPGGTTRDLFTRAIIHADIGGNCFMVRDVINGVDQIMFLRPDWTMILMSGDPTQDSHLSPVALIYKPGHTEAVKDWVIYPFDGSNGRVAHWAPIPDPHAFYRGMSWLTPIIREAITDKGISMQKLRYFQNGARPGIVGSFDKDVTPEQVEEFKTKFYQTKVGATNAYKPLFIGGGCTLTELTTSVEDFDTIAGASELRIAAASQVPAVLVGLGIEAMKGSTTAFQEGNFQAAKDAFIDGTMRPLWGHFAETVQSLVDTPDGMRLWYDDRDISYLREDQTQVAQRKQIDATTLGRLVQDGWTSDSAKEALLQDDFSLLEHTGLYSVQLMPPGLAHAKGFDGDDPAEDQAPPTGKQSPNGKQAGQQPNSPGSGQQQSKDEDSAP